MKNKLILPIEFIIKAFELNLNTFHSIIQEYQSEYQQGFKTSYNSGLATMVPSLFVKCSQVRKSVRFLCLVLV